MRQADRTLLVEDKDSWPGPNAKGIPILEIIVYRDRVRDFQVHDRVLHIGDVVFE